MTFVGGGKDVGRIRTGIYITQVIFINITFFPEINTKCRCVNN